MVIPGPLLEAELDLEADEQRCLEESMMNVEMAQDASGWEDDEHHKKQYYISLWPVNCHPSFLIIKFELRF